jgi:hypothetical protein
VQRSGRFRRSLNLPGVGCSRRVPDGFARFWHHGGTTARARLQFSDLFGREPLDLEQPLRDCVYPGAHRCGNFLFDIFMTVITGGVWLIWIFVREMRRR